MARTREVASSEDEEDAATSSSNAANFRRASVSNASAASSGGSPSSLGAGSGPAGSSSRKWIPTQDKPYKCTTPGCTAAYRQMNGLKYHRAHGKCSTAEGDAESIPYTCYDQELCRKKYRNMNGLRYHYQHSDRHGDLGMAMLVDGTHPPFQRQSGSTRGNGKGDAPTGNGNGVLHGQPLDSYDLHPSTSTAANPLRLSIRLPLASRSQAHRYGDQMSRASSADPETPHATYGTSHADEFDYKNSTVSQTLLQAIDFLSQQDRDDEGARRIHEPPHKRLRFQPTPPAYAESASRPIVADPYNPTSIASKRYHPYSLPQRSAAPTALASSEHHLHLSPFSSTDVVHQSLNDIDVEPKAEYLVHQYENQDQQYQYEHLHQPHQLHYHHHCQQQQQKEEREHEHSVAPVRSEAPPNWYYPRRRASL